MNRRESSHQRQHPRWRERLGIAGEATEQDVIDTPSLKRSFQRLNNLNFFETVEILPQQVDADKVDLVRGYLGELREGRRLTVPVLAACGRAAQAKTYKVNLSDAEWRKRLTSAQYQVLRHEDTEPPPLIALA